MMILRMRRTKKKILLLWEIRNYNKAVSTKKINQIFPVKSYTVTGGYMRRSLHNRLSV